MAPGEVPDGDEGDATGDTGEADEHPLPRLGEHETLPEKGDRPGVHGWRAYRRRPPFVARSSGGFAYQNHRQNRA